MNSISIIGGDLRIVRLAQMYAKEFKVFTYGLERYFENNAKEENIILCDKMECCIDKSNLIISSVPFTKDNKNVIAPFSNNKIEIEKFRENLQGKKFVAGNIPEQFYNCEIENVDLLKNEELTILNAIPTVEGTIKMAIDESEETIHESNVLICGYGRIGKILCNRFYSFGANIYCSARKDSDLAWIREKRYTPLKYNEIKEYAHKLDFIINTVPHIVIEKEVLDNLKKKIILIDIASYPGGIDKEYAKNKGIDVINAQGIPGREMPTTAAKYIKKIIDEQIMYKK